MAECRPEGMTWADLGATGQEDFVRQCRRDWNETNTELSSREYELAIDVCQDTREEVPDMSCELLVALYGPGG